MNYKEYAHNMLLSLDAMIFAAKAAGDTDTVYILMRVREVFLNQCKEKVG